MDWSPTIDAADGPVYEGIVEALDRDIASGRLRRGQRLPTHRALAQTLGVDLTTVTRAYNEARRRGLTDARVGQGTFVAESRSRPVRATAGIAIDFMKPSRIPLPEDFANIRRWHGELSARPSWKAMRALRPAL